MKKYIFGIAMVSLLSTIHVGIAMEKKKKKVLVETSLSSQEVAELRKAIENYKKNRSRAKQEEIINNYKDTYLNDPFVVAKVNEKMRFDNSMQPIQVVKKRKKTMPETALSFQEVTELRKAIEDYKKNRSRAKQEEIINNYREIYPNDRFVAAKVNEKARFDMSAVVQEQPTQMEIKSSGY